MRIFIAGVNFTIITIFVTMAGITTWQMALGHGFEGAMHVLTKVIWRIAAFGAIQLGKFFPDASDYLIEQIALEYEIVQKGVYVEIFFTPLMLIVTFLPVVVVYLLWSFWVKIRIN